MKKIRKTLARKEAIFVPAITFVGTLIWSLLDQSNEAFVFCGISGLSAIFLLFIRKTSRDDTYFYTLKSNLHETEKQFKQLKPFSALEQLESFNTRFDSTKLDESSKEKILGKFHFLKGQCLIQTSEKKSEGFEELIKAYKLDTDDLEIKERAITSFYYLDQIDQALKICEEILEKDPYNARAWVLQVIGKRNNSIDQVPANVLEKTDFKFILTTILIKKNKIKEVLEILKVDTQQDFKDTVIRLDNFHYFLQLAFFLYTDFFSKHTLYVDPNKNYFLFGNSELEKIRTLLKKILGLYGQTELFQSTPYYRQTRIFYNFTEYYLDKNETSILENFKILNEGFEYATNGMIMQLSICLADIDALEKLLSIYNHKQYKDFLDLELVLAEYHSKNGRPKESLEYYTNYLNKIDAVDSRDIMLVLTVIDLSYTSDQDCGSFVSSILREKKFQKDYYKNLIIAYHLRFYEDKDEEVYETINTITTVFGELTKEEKIAVCSVLATIQKHEECETYLRSLVNIDKESPELRFYIEVLHRLKKNHEELLIYLGKWNDDYSVDPKFLSWEIQIKYLQGDIMRVESLAKKGKLSFPASIHFLIHLCLALFRNERNDELKDLKMEISGYDIPYQSAFQLASIYFQIGENEFASELAYKQLMKHPNNVVVKQGYFTLLAYGNRERVEDQISLVDKDCTIRVVRDNQKKLIHINDETLDTNKVAKEFLGKKLNDIVHIEEPLTGSISEYHIIQIMDKYTGMIAEISEDLKEPTKIEGYDIVSIEAPTGDINAFNKKLRETFGYEGEKRHSRIQDAFAKYEIGKLSFSELLIRVNEDHPLQIYDHLTQFGRWFRIPPLEFVKKVDYSKIKEFVVDITSLAPLMAFSDELEKTNAEFIISSFLIEHIKQQISELEQSGDEPMTLAIRMERVEPHIIGKRELDHQLKKYKSYLDWIDRFCRVEYSATKLDVISQFEDYDLNRWYFNYWVDTIFLSNSNTRSLITNDELNFRNFFQQCLPMTTEYFLLSHEISGDLVSKYHLENKYVGVKINEKILQLAFDSTSIYERNQLFKNCINALHFNFHGDKNVIFEVIRFLKSLYSSSTNKTFKNSVAEGMIYETFKSYPLDKNFSKEFLGFIKKEFEFLPLDQVELMQVVLKVFDILNFKDHQITN